MSKKSLFILIFSVFCFLSSVFCFQSFSQSTETITLTTYYPSPVGVYNELKSKKSAIGDDYFDNIWRTDAVAPGTGEIHRDADLVVEGNVGIGTTYPRLKTNISGARAKPSSSGNIANGIMMLEGAAGNDEALVLGLDNALPWGSWLQAQNITNSNVPRPLAFNPNGGNVGIGTTSPASDIGWAIPALDISGTRGTAILRTTNSTIATLRMVGTTASSLDDWHINMHAGATSRISFNPQAGSIAPAGLTLLNNGNVGIGTTAPMGPLQIDSYNNVDTWGGWREKIRLSDPSHAAITYYDSDNDRGWMIGFHGVNDMMYFGRLSSWSGKTGAWAMYINASGNVGIGGTPTTAKLAVVNGSYTDTLGSNTTSDTHDIAETISAVNGVEVGDIVSVDSTMSQRVIKSQKVYDLTLLGVITAKPAILIGSTDGNNYIALAGRAAVKVTNENGLISRGDYITSSSKPGYGMKATKSGRVLGVSLGEFNEKEGKVVVFINPGWWGGDSVDKLEEINKQFQSENNLLKLELCKKDNSYSWCSAEKTREVRP